MVLNHEAISFRNTLAQKFRSTFWSYLTKYYQKIPCQNIFPLL
jgi:hypothetical protein